MVVKISRNRIQFEGVRLNLARATVASHATTADIWTVPGNQIDWTGTATTTAFPNAPQGGVERILICAGASSFTAGANMLIDGVTSGSTVTCAANDQVIVRSVSTTQFKLSRIKYDGTAQVGGSSVVRSARTSNTILAAADNSTLIDITSGTFSQTFTAAATLGSGWFCHIRNSGTGDITLDPNSTETIDALTTYVMYGGETRLVQCDGTNFNSVVLSPFYRAFTATGANTFTKPPGYTRFDGHLWGGGDGGGRGVVTNAAGGGGGACAPFTLLASAVGTTETVTIGAGGTVNQGVGGTSTFGSLVTAYGGGGGSTGNGGGGGGNYGAGGNGSGGNPAEGQTVSIFATYGGGVPANVSVGGGSIYGGGAGGGASTPSAGGVSIWGGGGGGGGSDPTSAAGGISRFGGNGGAGAGDVANGNPGIAPGGGGGGVWNGASSINVGARGECRVWGIA